MKGKSVPFVLFKNQNVQKRAESFVRLFGGNYAKEEDYRSAVKQLVVGVNKRIAQQDALEEAANAAGGQK